MTDNNNDDGSIKVSDRLASIEGKLDTFIEAGLPRRVDLLERVVYGAGGVVATALVLAVLSLVLK